MGFMNERIFELYILVVVFSMCCTMVISADAMTEDPIFSDIDNSGINSIIGYTNKYLISDENNGSSIESLFDDESIDKENMTILQKIEEGTDLSLNLSGLNKLFGILALFVTSVFKAGYILAAPIQSIFNLFGQEVIGSYISGMFGWMNYAIIGTLVMRFGIAIMRGI